VREVARRDKEARFTALLHHVSLHRLGLAFDELNRRAAPGVDGVSWAEYEQDLGGSLRDLHERVQRGSYRASQSRRVYIPKADGRQRPLGIATLEDKVVQRAVVEVLNAVYEADFRGFSCGFRLGRGPHQVLDALTAGIMGKRVNWVLDADIRDFSGSLDRGWLEKFLRHRIADERVLRLIGKWLAAGVIEDGKCAHGDVIIVRWADDFIVGFEHRQDAERFLEELHGRFAKFGLELHPDKTRLIEFGRHAAATGRRVATGDRRRLISRLHAPVREVEERAVLGAADHDLETGAGQACRGESRDQAPRASAHPGARPLAGQRAARAHGVLRRARQRTRGQGPPRPGDPAVAQGAAAPQPEGPGADLGADGPDPETVAAARPHHASIPGGTLRCHSPKVGAQCGNPARWDLCGGPPARAVPTATPNGAIRAHERRATALRASFRLPPRPSPWPWSSSGMSESSHPAQSRRDPASAARFPNSLLTLEHASDDELRAAGDFAPRNPPGCARRATRPCQPRRATGQWCRRRKPHRPAGSGQCGSGIPRRPSGQPLRGALEPTENTPCPPVSTTTA
jgi:hypothetical protein